MLSSAVLFSFRDLGVSTFFVLLSLATKSLSKGSKSKRISFKGARRPLTRSEKEVKPLYLAGSV